MVRKNDPTVFQGEGKVFFLVLRKRVSLEHLKPLLFLVCDFDGKLARTQALKDKLEFVDDRT